MNEPALINAPGLSSHVLPRPITLRWPGGVSRLEVPMLFLLPRRRNGEAVHVRHAVIFSLS